MSIDFQPMEQAQPAQPAASSNSIDFQPMGSGQPQELSTGSDQNASRLGAFIAGSSNYGANFLESLIDVPSWLLEKSGFTDPAVQRQMRQDVHADLDKYFRSNENTPKGDVFNESYMKYPAYGAVPQAIGEVLTANKLMPGMSKLANPVARATANLVKQAPASALVSAGLAGPRTEDMDNAAVLGAAVPAAFSAAGHTIQPIANALASKFGLAEGLRNLVGGVNQDLLKNNQLNTTQKAAASISNLTKGAADQETANFNNIKAIPGTINPIPIANAVNEIKRSAKITPNTLPGLPEESPIIQNVPSNTKFSEIQPTAAAPITPNSASGKVSVLGQDQIKALNGITSDVQNMRNMGDAIQLKKTLGAYFNTFKVGNVPDNINLQFRNLKDLVDNAIGAKADAAGLTGDWEKAKAYHHQVIAPLQNSNAFEIADAYKNRAIDPQRYETAVKGLMTRATKTPEAMKTVLNMMDPNGSKILQQHIVKSIFDDVNVNPEAFDKNKALRTLNTSIAKFDGTMSKDSIDTLKGIKTMLEKGGASTAKQVDRNSTYFEHSLGGGVGGLIGAGLTGGAPVGAIGGAIVGMGAYPAIAKVISSSLQSPTGQSILRLIGKGAPWSNHVIDLIKASATVGAGNHYKAGN